MHTRPGWASIHMSRTSHHNELHGLDDVLPSIPTANLRKRVRADHEEHFAVRRLHPFDGVDRIPLLPAFFEPRGDKTRLTRAGQLHHPVAILIARPGFLERWIRGRNEQHAIERKCFRRLARHHQMGAVDRIEGSSEHRRSHKMRRKNSSSLSISIPILSQNSLPGATMAGAPSHKFITSFSVVTSASAPAAAACSASLFTSAGRYW